MTTPLPIDNRPGLGALRYRVGSYGDFRDSMLARLADPNPPFKPLNLLRTRSTDDPTIALVDAFAILGDILTFYQERLANEGYARTATQSLSVQYLSSLTGYQPRPGIASRVALAFTVDPSSTVTLPAGSRVQSVPGPGQTAQSFEIDDDLEAWGTLSAMQPRLTKPTQPAPNLTVIAVAGTNTGVKPNDPILQVVNGKPTLRRVTAVNSDPGRKRTVIHLKPLDAQSTPAPPPTPPSDPSSAAPSPTQPSAPSSAPPPTPPSAPSSAPPPTPPSAPSSAPPPTAPSAPSSAAPAPAANTSTAASPSATGRALTVEFGLPKETAGAMRLMPDLAQIKVMALADTFGKLASLPPAPHPPNAQALTQSDTWLFASDVLSSLTLSAGRTPAQRAATFAALAQTQLAPPPQLEFHAFRAKTAPFGNRAPPQVIVDTTIDWTSDRLETHKRTQVQTQEWLFSPPTEIDNKVLYLDGAFETIVKDSWVAFDAPTGQTQAVQVVSADTVSRAAYGQTARTSRLTLSEPWFSYKSPPTFESAIRQTSVYADSTKLTLVEEDITQPVGQSLDPKPTDPPSNTLELNGLFDRLTPGRWMIVSGERKNIPGSIWAERVMLAGVSHGGETVSSADGIVTAPGETPHTTLTFANQLAYSYERSTVQVFGNVMTATQGESTDEILGSGNGAIANQIFALKKPLLSSVPGAMPSGAAKTLLVRVNNIEWKMVDTLASAEPDARVFVTAMKADGSCSVQFGDGVHGARLPTGTENVRGHYRSGLGGSGNVDPGTVTTLLNRPLGLTAVTNPIAAKGGAGAESLDDARANVPQGVASLQRLVSVSDYQNFALAFGGIGKVAARQFAGPDGPLIYLTLAGADDNAPDLSKDPSSLYAALLRYGDPSLEVELGVRAERLVIIKANVAVDAAQWSDVEPAIRSAVLSRFGFSQRALGQSMYVSEVIAAIQGVPGVAYVDLRQLAGVLQPDPTQPPPDPTQLQILMASYVARETGPVRDIIAHHARIDPASTGRPRRLLPAELVYLPDIPAMLTLTQIQVPS
jgi:predicted phage baseplate assembly protein